jgi:hypothetical protein
VPTIFVATQPVTQVNIPGHLHIQEDMAKFISPTLRHINPVAFAFLTEFSLTDAAITDLLQKSAVTGTVAGAICSWLSENNATWGPWITAGRAAMAQPAGGATVPAIEKEDTDILSQEARITLGVIFLLVIMGLMARLCWMHSLVRRREGQLSQTKSSLDKHMAATLERTTLSVDSDGTGELSSCDTTGGIYVPLTLPFGPLQQIAAIG